MSLINETITYTSQDLENWKSKKLLNNWKKEFPDLIPTHLFNILDSRQSLNTYCFGELFTGIYYARKGFKFLYEPWIENFLLFRAKIKELKDLQEIFTDIFIQHTSRETYNFIQNNIAQKINKGQPDLFIYDETNSFFAEVKRKGDVVRKEQEFFIKTLDRSGFDLPIKLVSLQRVS